MLVATAESSDAPPLRVPARQGVLEIAGDAVYRVRLEAEHCWSETRFVTARESAPVTLRVYRLAAVSGMIQTAKPQTHLSVSGSSFDDQPLQCSVKDSRWRCEAPADVPFDLTLQFPGFAALRYWDVIVRPSGEGELEPKMLHPGASFSGWLRDPKGKPLADAHLALYPLEASAPDAKHVEARKSSAVSNARGFFQFTGMEGGRYRLVSQAGDWSPAILPSVELRAGEELVWPRNIVHASRAMLTAFLDPPRDRKGNPWTLELAEREPLHPGAKPRNTRHKASEDGRWEAARIGADAYELRVVGESGSILRRVDVDLSGGGPTSLQISVHDFFVRGVVKAGDEALEADLVFTDGSGGFVKTSSSADGSFEVGFPSVGRWSPSVQYPRKRGARTQGEPIEVREDTQAVEVALPGGRFRGTVFDAERRPRKAAVHVTRDRSLIAQQVTDEDGKFDLIGLRGGDYALDGEGPAGKTAHPFEVTLEQDETKDVDLVLSPYRAVAGVVVLPSGSPASGAVIRISLDGGFSWGRQVTDIDGRFERSVARSRRTSRFSC